MEQSDREMGTDSPGLEPTGSMASGLDGSLAEGRDSREEDAKWATGPPPDSNGTTIAQPAEAASAGSTFIYPCDELDCSDEEAARVTSHLKYPARAWSQCDSEKGTTACRLLCWNRAPIGGSWQEPDMA